MNRKQDKEQGEKLSEFEESALSRWSRRKSLSRSEKEESRNQQEAAPETEIEYTENALAGQASDDAPVEIKEFTDEDMPPVESLDENSDFAAFLSSGVSEKLRRAALRKLFHLEMFNVVDGLDDYAEDYTKFEKLGKIMTADLRLQKQRAEQALKQKTDSETFSSETDRQDEVGLSEAEEIEETVDLSDESTEVNQEKNKQVD